ncbi:putative high affinity immunoglobulin gamma Fc receptor IC [Mugil cephalus]|uniref:putative high affinity immunoglobulin gamma Fc receptor IC n=1 Tax=Mugil cephalus TaxID=48193 RepID=UPI001FB83B67|nr:putative high affinity immunoglobulin gamma Fc receptor IC [Mugil cephalus]
MVKRAQKRFYVLRRMRRAHLPPPILKTFYRSTIKNILTSCLCEVWRLQRLRLGEHEESVTSTLFYGNAQVLSKVVTVILQPNWPKIFRGETITLRCEIQGGGGTQWTYEWKQDELNKPPTSREYRINGATESDSGGYRCRGRGNYYLTEWSDTIRLTVSANQPQASLTVNNRVIPAGGSVTLTCSVEPSAGWRFYWFRGGSEFSTAQTVTSGTSSTSVSVSEGGIYHCRGGRGDQEFFTADSDAVTIEETVSSKATVILQPNWPQIFREEIITLRFPPGNSG